MVAGSNVWVSSQSIHAMPPSRIGAPDDAGRQPTPANLSMPLRANWAQSSSCPALRMFTQNAPAARIFGELVNDLSGRKATSGGSRDTDVNELTTMPTGPDGPIAVITATPVAKCPRTCRNRLESNAASAVATGVVIRRPG